MGKGRKKAQKSTDTLQPKVVKGTKENTPEMNKEPAYKTQSTLTTLWSPKKPRSPLGDNSSTPVQEQSDAVQPLHVAPSKTDKESRREERTEIRSPETGQRETGQRETGQRETGQRETGQRETGQRETGQRETGQRETGQRETGQRETGQRETGQRETGQRETVLKSSKEPQTLKNVSQSKKGIGTSGKVKKAENIPSVNKKVTDYYPVRRSGRKSKTELKNDERQHIDDLIKNGVEEGLIVKDIEGKGRGVFAVRDFKKGEYVVEYHGELVLLADAKKREDRYAKEPETGCYMYYFQYHGKTYCVDATKESGRMGRLINHSKQGNCQTKLHGMNGTPHLILITSRDVLADEEMLYDYGDRSKASISAHPWLKH